MSTAAAKPKRSRGKRMLRGLLWGSLGLVLAAVCLWIFRQPLLVPLIRPRLEAALATLLRAERVSIGALDGDWITSLDAKDITVENAGIPSDATITKKTVEGSFRGEIYNPLADLYLHFGSTESIPRDYRRELDLETAVSTVRYTIDGVTYKR